MKKLLSLVIAFGFYSLQLPVLAATDWAELTTEVGTESTVTITPASSTISQTSATTLENGATTTIIDMDGGTISGNASYHNTLLNSTNTLTINDGTFTSTNYVLTDGGAINNTGDLTLNNVSFTSNIGNLEGGAINNSGSVIINAIASDVSFADNLAGGLGGAIYSSGTVTLNANGFDISFTNNQDSNYPSPAKSNDIYINSSALTLNTVNVGDSITLNGGIAGTGSIIKSGLGTLTLSGLNSDYSGTYSQTAGTLTLNNTTFTGATGSSITNSTVNIDNTGTFALSGDITCSGTDSTTINIGSASDNNTFTLNSGTISSAGTGTTTVNVGTTGVSTGNSLNIAGGTLASSATVKLNTGNTLSVSAGSATMDAATGDTIDGSISLSGTGALTIDNLDKTTTSTSTYNQTSGALNLANGSDLVLATSDSIINGTSTVSLTENSTLTLQNGSANSALLTMGAGNTAILTLGQDASSAASSLALNSGSSIVAGTANIGAVGDTGNTLTANTGATISNDASVNVFAGNTLAVTGGDVTLNKNNTGIDNWAGTITNTAGKLTLSGVNQTTDATIKYTQNGTGELDIIKDQTGAGFTSNVKLSTSGSRIDAGTVVIGGTAAGDIGNTLDISTDGSTSSTLASAASVTIAAGNTLKISGGDAALNGTGAGTIDTWSGIIDLSSGTLTIDALDKTTDADAKITHTGGTLNLINDSDLILNTTDSSITTDGVGGTTTVQIGSTTANDTSSLNLASGTLESADSGDTLNVNIGTASQTGNTLTVSGATVDTSAHINLYANNNLNISSGSVTLGDDTTVANDYIGGNLNLSDTGSLTITGWNNNLHYQSEFDNFVYTQTGGTALITGNTDYIGMGSNATQSTISGWDITVNGASNVSLYNVLADAASGKTINLNIGTDASGGVGTITSYGTITAASGGTTNVNIGSATATGNSLTISAYYDTPTSTSFTGNLASSATVVINNGNTLNVQGDITAGHVGGSATLNGADTWGSTGIVNVSEYGTLTLEGLEKVAYNSTTGTDYYSQGANAILNINGENGNAAGLTVSGDAIATGGIVNLTGYDDTYSSTLSLTYDDNTTNTTFDKNVAMNGHSALEINAANGVTVTNTSATNITSATTTDTLYKSGLGTYDLDLSGLATDATLDYKVAVQNGTMSVTTDNTNVARLMENITVGTTHGATTGTLDVTGGSVAFTNAVTLDAGSTMNVTANATTGSTANFNGVTTVGEGSLYSASTLNVDADDVNFNGGLTLSNGVLNVLSSGFDVTGDMNIGSEANTINGVIATNNISGDMNITAGDTANFLIDLSPTAGTSDSYNIDGTIQSTISGDKAYINISNYQLISDIPAESNINFQIFDASSISNDIEFTNTNKIYSNKIGDYGLFSQGNGAYNLTLTDYNSQVFRGQVATVSAYANQLTTNNMLFDHIGLVSQQFLSEEKPNVYANQNPLFAPYQYSMKDGGLWYKSYANIERLDLSQGINTQNNTWGSLVGADFPLMELKNGWKFLPTAYIGYTGGHQGYNGVSMYQNGGQGGLMGTFYKGDFLSSLLVNAGGYGNNMSVGGTTDSTGNWFAGVASKTAYNVRMPKDFILQPNVLFSYNAFGGQNWNSSYGNMDMTSNMLNGLVLAPGLNLILNKETWSVYVVTQLAFNIMNGSSGNAGNVDLPSVGMGTTYFQYGVGFTKRIKDRLSVYGQIVMSNGVRTGVGFQGGLQWKF